MQARRWIPHALVALLAACGPIAFFAEHLR